MKVAVSNRFKAASELIDGFQQINADALLFKDIAALEQLIMQERFDLVMDINFHSELHAFCADKNIPYIVWSFDSGVESVLKRSKVSLRDNDFLFLFNKLDYEYCSKIHHNSFYLPFSAADFFIREARQNNFKNDVLVIMSTYMDTIQKSENEFQRIFDSADEFNKKLYALSKSLMELSISSHSNIIDRNSLPEFLDEYVAKCGINPFNEFNKDLFLSFYGQILSSKQRKKCLEVISSSVSDVKLYGDELWQGILGNCPSVKFSGMAPYESLPDLYNQAKININLTQIQNMDSVPQRIFHVLAAGGFVLSNYSDALAELFKPGIELETFRSFEEMQEKITFFLKNDDIRHRISDTGHMRFMRSHRMNSRLGFILEKFKKK